MFILRLVAWGNTCAFARGNGRLAFSSFPKLVASTARSLFGVCGNRTFGWRKACTSGIAGKRPHAPSNNAPRGKATRFGKENMAKNVLAFLATLVASSPALAGTYTTSGERTPAEIQRNVGECLDRLQNEPLAGEICNAEQNLPGNPTAYKPRDRKTFAACLKVLPRGKYAAQSRAICADNDVTNRGHPASGNLGHFEIRK